MPMTSSSSSTLIEDLAFELLLLPDSLEAKLEGKDLSQHEQIGLLKKFLEWLQTERIRDAAAMAQAAAADAATEVQEVIKVPLVSLDPISGQQQRSGVSKKRLMLQKMTLQLFSVSGWNMAEFTSKASSGSSGVLSLSLSLQHELMSTLLCVCGVQHLLADLRPDSIGELLNKQTPSGVFAFQVRKNDHQF